jgi:hypothetical protein
MADQSIDLPVPPEYADATLDDVCRAVACERVKRLGVYHAAPTLGVSVRGLQIMLDKWNRVWRRSQRCQPAGAGR